MRPTRSLRELRGLGLGLAASTLTAAASAGDCGDRPPPTRVFIADSGALPVPTGGQIVTIRFEDLPPFLDWAYPSVRFEAAADLGLETELLQARVNGGTWETIGFWPESDCPDPPNCSNWQPWIPIGELGATLVVEVRSSAAVDVGSCPEGFIRLRIQYLVAGDPDCDGNGIADACEIEAGTVEDCNEDGRPDSCEAKTDPLSDCDGNGIHDCCDFRDGRHDCDRNGRLDDCDIAETPSKDCNGNGLLDGCEVSSCLVTDANLNRRPDGCDIADGLLADCNGNGMADLVELATPGNDVDGDHVLDECDPRSADIYADGVVNPADLAVLLSGWGGGGPAADLNRDGVVGPPDLSILLGEWGPVPVCGDSILAASENCCNCPADAGCGPGFDCFYGSCVPCPGGLCPPAGLDGCEILYGTAPGYGSRCCWSEGYSPCPDLPYGDCGCTGYMTGYGYEYMSCGYGCGYGYGWGGYTPCNRNASSLLICGVPVLGAHRGGNFAMTAITVDWPVTGTLAASAGLLGFLTLPAHRIFRRNRPGRTGAKGPSSTSP